MTDLMQQEFDWYKRLVDDRLRALFRQDRAEYGALPEAMRYSLLAGGKRIRPVMLLAFCNAFGGDVEKAVRPACAVEMLHTYSLIHDDLPCMDDDDLRRGVPTNHVMFGEYTATLAGDALQAEAFHELLSSGYPAGTLVMMGRFLAEAAGLQGICGGQILDMEGEGKDIREDELRRIHRLKTASLLAACAKMGVAAGGGDKFDAAGEYAEAVGLAFQMRDDILNATGAPEVTGKPAGSDAERGKSTFVSIYGIDRCEELIEMETARAARALADFERPEFLIWLAEKLAERKY